MLKYIAYKRGGRIPYSVSQIIWKNNEEFVIFNGELYNAKDCVLCADTGYKDSKGKNIYEGDILQLNIIDRSCHNSGKVGVVSFHDTKFCWTPISGYWKTYSLAGKKWTKLGNIACDTETYYTTEQINKNSFLRDMRDKVRGYFIGVCIEKTKSKTIIDENKKIATNTEIINKKSQKNVKQLLYQYKNYLKIKEMIEKKEIIPEIIESNLD